jgi:hypothetical protein
MGARLVANAIPLFTGSVLLSSLSSGSSEEPKTGGKNYNTPVRFL